MKDVSEKISDLIEEYGATIAELVKMSMTLSPDNKDLRDKAGSAGIGLFMNALGKLMEEEVSSRN